MACDMPEKEQKMTTPEENRARVERFREKDIKREKKDRWVRQCIQQGVDPSDGKSALEPDMQQMLEALTEGVERENRRRDMLPYTQGKGVIHARSRKGGRNRKVRRGG